MDMLNILSQSISGSLNLASQTKAIVKIKAEMEKEKNVYVQVIGKFLLEQLNINPDLAEKVLNKNKTIMKSLDEMRKVAQKRKVGNCGVLSDAEGFEIVIKYFNKTDVKVEKDKNIKPSDNETENDEAESKSE